MRSSQRETPRPPSLEAAGTAAQSRARDLERQLATAKSELAGAQAQGAEPEQLRAEFAGSQATAQELQQALDAARPSSRRSRKPSLP